MLPLQPPARLHSYMCVVSHECTGVHVCVCARANACMHACMQSSNVCLYAYTHAQTLYACVYSCKCVRACWRAGAHAWLSLYVLINTIRSTNI